MYALVTGASRGIGREIALTLAREGACVIVNYNGSKERAQEVVDTILAQGGKAAAYQCSVSDFDACQEMIQSLIKEYGHIDEKHIRQCTLRHIKCKQQHMSHHHQKDGNTFHLIKIFKSLHSKFISCNQLDRARVSSVTDILP